MKVHSTGWACTDCMMLIANGETPPELDEQATAEWMANFERITEGLDVVPGGEHEEDCPNVDAEGNWLGTTDCSCEDQDFSWSRCDTCGSTLGGHRHAVTFFVKEAV